MGGWGAKRSRRSGFGAATLWAASPSPGWRWRSVCDDSPATVGGGAPTKGQAGDAAGGAVSPPVGVPVSVTTAVGVAGGRHGGLSAGAAVAVAIFPSGGWQAVALSPITPQSSAGQWLCLEHRRQL